MKKISALILAASLMLLIILAITRKFSVEATFYSDWNLIHWLGSFFKTIVVLFAYIAGFFAIIVITFVDILSSMIWKVEFPILHLVYDKFYLGFSKGWYWDQFQGGYLFLSAIIILLIAMIVLAIPDNKRKARYLYDPANFAPRT